MTASFIGPRPRDDYGPVIIPLVCARPALLSFAAFAPAIDRHPRMGNDGISPPTADVALRMKRANAAGHGCEGDVGPWVFKTGWSPEVSMRICLVDLSAFDFTPQTPRTQPLGGMQSGLSYLAHELAKRGHRVRLLNRSSTPGIHAGIECVSLAESRFPEIFEQCDIVVSIYCDGQLLRYLGVRCPLVLWTGHNSDEPTVQKLRQVAERTAWSKFVFKSQTQADEFKAKFGINDSDYEVIGNAISPFVAASPTRSQFFFPSDACPKFIYSSTPFRGLDTLLHAWPMIRRVFPESTLDVYSGMGVYQQVSDSQFAPLYERCKSLDGVRYFGSVNQPELAMAYSRADILAFPSTYRETSCITVMEAMASGCIIVSTTLGAIPETCNGFGFLTELPKTRKLKRRVEAFTRATIDAVHRIRSKPAESSQQVSRQIHFARQVYQWPKRAEQFERLLASLNLRRSETATVANPQVLHATVPVQALTTPSTKTIYVNPGDRRGIQLIQSGGNLNAKTMTIWQQLVTEEPWTHIVDVGSNYGEMLANVSLPADASILAIEPNPTLLPCLRLTLTGFKRVTLHEVALSNRSGTANFFIDSNWSGTSRIAKPRQANARVPVTTLDSLLNLSRSRLKRVKILLKIDVEGFEVYVLRGALRTLGFANRAVALIEVAHVARKYHPWLLRHFAVFGYDIRQNTLRQINTLEPSALEANGIYPNDLVLRNPRFHRSVAAISLYASEAARFMLRSCGLQGRARAG